MFLHDQAGDPVLKPLPPGAVAEPVHFSGLSMGPGVHSCLP